MHFAQGHVPKIDKIRLVLCGHPKELQTVKELKGGNWHLLSGGFSRSEALLGPFTSLVSPALKDREYCVHWTKLETESQRGQVIWLRLVNDRIKI